VVLERRHRLTTAAGFSAATRGGRRAGTSTLVLHLAVPETVPPTGTDDPARVGFAVGRGVGNAVTRNRVRRRLRHLLGARLDALPDGSLLVARGLPAAAEASYAVLGRDVDRALRKLGRPVATSPTTAPGTAPTTGVGR
jgi:ribonuclease P protein component